MIMILHIYAPLWTMIILIYYLGFDKQTDVVNLFSNGGHSPSCFWVGGYEVKIFLQKTLVKCTFFRFLLLYNFFPNLVNFNNI